MITAVQPDPINMNSPIYHSLFLENKKVFALLIDPEKLQADTIKKTVVAASQARVDVILVGGSLTSQPIDETIVFIKDITDIPVLLFPGNLLQMSAKADGILLLSLLSGRNPEYLIGNHVLAAQFLKKSGLEIIPTGYILIDGHYLSSVEYMSNTRPIPSEKADIIVATSLAGEQLGLKLIYLEAGSGANDKVKENIVAAVRDNLSVPLIIGGGIRTPEDIRGLYKAGANGVVVGTAVEDDYHVLFELAAVRDEF
jgi:phosphoglycerol geranylgeranyltransferase